MTTNSDMFRTGNHRSFDKKTIVPILFLLGWVIASASILLAVLLWLTGNSVTAVIGTLLGITNKTAWHLSRSAGTVAYLLLAGSTVWGLLQSSKIAKEAIPAGLSFAMHNVLSWLALAFTGLHALVLLFDGFYTYTVPDLIIPFIGPYRPLWVGLGIIGFYLMAIVTISFRYRKQIGQKSWRTLHHLSFVVYVLATIHGLAAGTDSNKISMLLMYLGSGLIIFFLTTYRVLTSRALQSRLTEV